MRGWTWIDADRCLINSIESVWMAAVVDGTHPKSRPTIRGVAQ
jgi:hypothetical protein